MDRALLLQQWARNTFLRFRGAVAYVETVGHTGDPGIGTCFHVGEGVFVTARHVVDGRTIVKIDFDDWDTSRELLGDDPSQWGRKQEFPLVLSGPHFHPDPRVDVACFRLGRTPSAVIPLGGHLDDWLGQYELVLHRCLIMGYPPIPMADRALLFATVGEVNALVDLYGSHKHPHFIVSSMGRGGLSGAPALIAYNELSDDGTAALGLVTESLILQNWSIESGYLAVLTVEPIYVCLEHHGLLPELQKIV
jgi:hypothetical protein